jgi:hypothetical protein
MANRTVLIKQLKDTQEALEKLLVLHRFRHAAQQLMRSRAQGQAWPSQRSQREAAR